MAVEHESSLVESLKGHVQNEGDSAAVPVAMAEVQVESVFSGADVGEMRQKVFKSRSELPLGCFPCHFGWKVCLTALFFFFGNVI